MNRPKLWLFKEFSSLTLEELYAIMVLRQEVFVVEQDCPYLDADGKDQLSHHVMGFIENKLLAYTRIVKPGISYEEVAIGRVISAQSERRTGLGIELMEKSIEYTEELYGKVPIRISAQQHLEKFYGKFNFVTVSDMYLEDDIPHVEMLKTV